MKSIPIEIQNTFKRAYTIDPSLLIPYGGGQEGSDGVVFRFQGEKAGDLLKILHLGTGNTHFAELHFTARIKFLAFLNQSGVPTMKLIPALDGLLYQRLDAPSGCWVAYAMKKVVGKTMSPNIWDPDLIQNWGRTIGKLHQATQSYPEWHDCVDPESGESFLTWESEWQSFYAMCEDADVCHRLKTIKAIFDALPVRRDCFGFIHNDPHLWNLRINNSQVILLDFDVANHHWFITDIAISISSQHILNKHSGGFYNPVKNREFLVDFFKAFIFGYDQENDLDHTWLTHLDTFIAYRRILLYLLSYNWRKSNPDLQKSWKEMIVVQPEILGKIDL